MSNEAQQKKQMPTEAKVAAIVAAVFAVVVLTVVLVAHHTQKVQQDERQCEFGMAFKGYSSEQAQMMCKS